MKHYIQRVFQNPEDIIVLVRDLKDPTIVLNKSRPTALSEEDEKYRIMVMIQTEEIKKFVKKISILQQNTLKIYVLIWVQFSPALQSDLEEDQ